MKRDVTLLDRTHELRNASAISGALIGGTTGILGGIAGIGAAGLFGAVLGALGGLALEHQVRRQEVEEDEDGEAYAKAAALIEPPCADCIDVNTASGGTVTACARHTKHRASGHLHYEYPQAFGVGSMFLRPAT